jgi:hypothetical protein
MPVAETTNTSAYELRQTQDLPADSACRMAHERLMRENGYSWLGGYWHVWHSGDRFCAYHNSLKAPCARVVITRRDNERRASQLAERGQ